MKRPPPTRSDDEWVVVAQYAGMEADMDADFAVSVLKGSNIPAVRFPVVQALTLGRGIVLEPVRVLVPPSRAEDAKELLKEDE
jgi:hypothetical protein